MTPDPLVPAQSSPVGRLLARFDRLPYLGGGRTHVAALALFFAASLSCYLLVLKLRGPAATIRTWTPWDAVFPFIPLWTWVYMIPYVVGPLLAGALSRSAFIWYIERGILVVVVSIAIYAIVPTQTVRPVDVESKLGNDLTAVLYRNMAAIDNPPANAAPSLHVSLSCLLAWAITFDLPRWRWAALAGALVVWLSTLFTAQHHLIDVATGAALASLAAIGPPRAS
jgi:hypothetical protein